MFDRLSLEVVAYFAKWLHPKEARSLALSCANAAAGVRASRPPLPLPLRLDPDSVECFLRHVSLADIHALVVDRRTRFHAMHLLRLRVRMAVRDGEPFVARLAVKTADTVYGAFRASSDTFLLRLFQGSTRVVADRGVRDVLQSAFFRACNDALRYHISDHRYPEHPDGLAALARLLGPTLIPPRNTFYILTEHIGRYGFNPTMAERIRPFLQHVADMPRALPSLWYPLVQCNGGKDSKDLRGLTALCESPLGLTATREDALEVHTACEVLRRRNTDASLDETVISMKRYLEQRFMAYF